MRAAALLVLAAMALATAARADAVSQPASALEDQRVRRRLHKPSKKPTRE